MGTKKVAVLTIHGMGDTESGYANGLKAELASRLDGTLWNNVHFGAVYYQTVLQAHQLAMFKRMKLESEIDYIALRKFMLFGFSDAAGLERNATAPNSPYAQVQKIIHKELNAALKSMVAPNMPVLFIAHSLGGQVLSNYLWDSQHAPADRGIWKDTQATGTAEDNFLRLKTLDTLYTTGCNIPIFLAGFPESEIKAVKTDSQGYKFEWHNYYDKDDVLGWPLKPMSKSYDAAVTKDHAINADGGLLGKIFKAWNPLSHGAYWEDNDFLKPLVNRIAALAV